MAKKSARSTRKSTKKSPRKKAARKATPKSVPKKERQRIWPLALIAAGVLVILVAIAVFLAQRESEPTTLVVVNEEAITQAEVAFQYRLLPQSYRVQVSEQQVIEQIIDEELIVQAAKAEGVVVKEEEVNSRVQGMLEGNQLTVQQLEENLALSNVTLDDFERLIERQIYIERYTQEFLGSEEPTDEELQDLYETRREEFATPEQVRVRHILISSQREEAARIAKDLYDRVREGEDFCALVRNSTDDRGSLETCGEYTFSRGFMVAPFEEASFEMEEGEVRLVQTQFGYHVIEKLEDLPAGELSFEQARERLAQEFSSARRIQQYQSLTSSLRDSAQISYTEEYERIYGVPPEEEFEPEAPEAPVEEPPAETPIAEPESPIAEPVETEPEESSADLLSCIAESATLYGASWDSNTQQALALFEDAGVELDHVLCDARGAACEGIEGYPTWRIGGETYLGRMSVAQLSRAAGCGE